MSQELVTSESPVNVQLHAVLRVSVGARVDYSSQHRHFGEVGTSTAVARTDFELVSRSSISQTRQ